MHWRGVLLSVACALAIGGCGDEADEASTSTSDNTSTAQAETTTAAGSDATGPEAPAPLTACGPGGWHPLHVRSGPGKLDVAVSGKGQSAVVLANESGDQSCAWVPYAKTLADEGLAVAVFSYQSIGNPDEITAVAEALRAQGAKRVAAIGASVGARAVVVLASERNPGIDAAISLSAERSVGGVGQYPDILPKAKQAELPSFYISSRGDGYTLFGKETKQMHEATPAQVNEILLVPGSGHGVDLVEGKAGKTVRPAIIAFLRNLGFAQG